MKARPTPARTLKTLALATATAVLAACASATPFQPASEFGAFDGYSSQMITDDRVRVTFGGNSLTDRDQVENSVLYRTAQIALENGFDHFTLDERDTEERTRLELDRRPGSLGRAGFGGAGFAGGGFYDPYFGYSFFRPRVGWSRFYPYSRFGVGSRFDPRFRFSRFSSFHDPFFDDGYDVREVTRYRAVAEARLGRGPAPDAPSAFDAREVIANLGPSIDFPNG